MSTTASRQAKRTPNLAEVKKLIQIRDGEGIDPYNPLSDKVVRDLVNKGYAELYVPYSTAWFDLNPREAEPSIRPTENGNKLIQNVHRKASGKTA